MFAWSNYQLGRGSDAEALFNKALLLSPNDTSALEGLGLLKKK
jgi:Flp pilus assembly protein TadD